MSSFAIKRAARESLLHLPRAAGSVSALRTACAAVVLAAVGAMPVAAFGQEATVTATPTHVTYGGGGGGGGGATVVTDQDWIKKLAIDPESPQAKKYAAQQKVRKQAEKEMRKVRFKYLGSMRNTELRQEGLVKLRGWTDPALFSSLMEVFAEDQLDVKATMLDQFLESKSDEGDACAAWMATFDRDAEVRGVAVAKLRKRIAENVQRGPDGKQVVGVVPYPVKLVVYEGLRTRDKDAMKSAAELANLLDLVESIPWLIAAQLSGGPVAGADGTGGGAGGRQGALAWIMVGEQTAFVSDLTPVVAEGAVAFDPQVSVLNTGVLLRVIDAVVVTYHYDVHAALVDLSTRAGAEVGLGSTAPLGWDTNRWYAWHSKEFVPKWNAAVKAAQDARDKKAKEEAEKKLVTPPAPK